MKQIAALLVITGGALLATATQAADAIYPDYDLPVVPVEEGFDWDGFYAGVGISGSFFAAGARSYGAGAFVGGNVTLDNILVGIEASAHYGYSTPGDAWGYVLGLEGRAGYLVSPDVLAYASAGLAYMDPAPSNWFSAVGAGAEFAVTDSMTVDVQYRYLWNDASSAHSIGASTLFHF